VSTALPERRDSLRGHSAPRRTRAESLASVYVDMSATSDAVRAAVAKLRVPRGVVSARIDDRSTTDTFGCRIAVELSGPFNQDSEGFLIARRYAGALSALLGIPAFALYDLLRSDTTRFHY
jgi:hypothetical protein